MAKVFATRVEDILHTLPEIVTFDSASGLRGTKEDLFLCALGFEPRGLTVPRALAEMGYSARRARYFEYSTNADDNEANRPELEACLGQLSNSVESIRCEEQDFPSTLSKLLDAVEGTDKSHPPRVTFDISVAANRLLLRTIGVLLQRNISLRILYSEAGTYHPTEEEFKKNFQSWATDETLGLEQGVSEVLPSKEQPGHHLDPLPNCIIVFPTFKAARARAVIAAIDPSLLAAPGKSVYWMLGEPHLPEDKWRLKAMAKINGVAQGLPQFNVKTFDYKDTLRTLEFIHGHMWEQHNLSIAQFGSKLQTLGTSLFCFLHPEVRLWYAIPRKYNAANFSDGCKATWALDFGPMQETRNLLNAVGKLKIAE